MPQFASPPSTELTSLPHLTRRRVFAYLTDRAVLALVGLGVVLLFKPFVGWLGGYQLLLGWSITVVYFGPFAMLLGNRTLGHHVFGLEVVDAQGDKLSAHQHWLRALVLATSALDGHISVPSYGLLLTVAATMLTVCQFVMLLWHSRQGRLLHDLLFNTHVRRAAEADLWIYTPLTAGQERSILGAVALACAMWGGVCWHFHTLDGSFFTALKQAYPIVTAFWGPHQTSGTYLVTVSSYAPPTAAVAESIACLALRDLPEAKRAAKLQIVVNQVTRLGIINLDNRESFAYPPSEWLSQKGARPPF